MVRIALIGCGTMGRTHSAAYATIGNAKVVSVCDLDSAKRTKVAALHGAEAFASYEEMEAKGGFDVLDVCLPTYLHKEYAVRAMRKGYHVFSEKPIALNVEDAEEMVRTARENHVKFSVGHVLRFFPEYVEVEKEIQSGRLGVPRLIRTTRNQAFPAWSWENWYQDEKKSGGVIMDLVIHDIDWILHAIGPVERVYAKSFNGKVEKQDHCLVILKLASGAIAHVEGSWAYPKGSPFRMTYEVVGTKAQVEYDSVSDSPITLRTNTNDVPECQFLNPMAQAMEPYRKELQLYVDAVDHGTDVVVTGEESIETLRVVLAAVKSSKTGESVEVSK
jgi:UDP-N-acetylglucosamine 3-dehydrogenase